MLILANRLLRRAFYLLVSLILHIASKDSLRPHLYQLRKRIWKMYLDYIFDWWIAKTNLIWSALVYSQVDDCWLCHPPVTYIVFWLVEFIEILARFTTYLTFFRKMRWYQHTFMGLGEPWAILCVSWSLMGFELILNFFNSLANLIY